MSFGRGDCAAVVNAFDGKLYPPTAQFAEAQAKQLAANIVARLNGRPTRPFRYRPRDERSSIGHNKASAEIMRVRLSDFVAWLMWRGPAFGADTDAVAHVPIVSGVELGDLLTGCGRVPHREKQAIILEAVARFLLNR